MRKEKIKIHDYEFTIESNFDYRDFGLKKNSQIQILKKVFDNMNVKDSVFIPQRTINSNNICCYISKLRNEYYKDTVIFKRIIIRNSKDEVVGCRVFRLN